MSSDLRQKISNLNSEIEKTSSIAIQYEELIGKLQNYVVEMKNNQKILSDFLDSNNSPDARLQQYNNNFIKILNSMKNVLNDSSKWVSPKVYKDKTI